MLNDQQQTKKLFADGWTMIKGCSTDYSTTDSTEKKNQATSAEKLQV